VATFFADHFGVPEDAFDAYGAFNISLVNDLPLFIDPFLLFQSEKDEYVQLHDRMIEYLVFLRDKAQSGAIDDGLLRAWYCFPEVRQNWLGFSLVGNSGSGLGMDFARALHSNLHRIFGEFGREKVTEGSHLEKVCLIADGVGRDNVSDFTTNLIKDYLCKYTETFALKHLQPDDVKEAYVDKAWFDVHTESWARGKYVLPWVNGDYVILTPKDMLTRDENWINKSDMIRGFEQIPTAIPDGQLRAQVSNYFYQVLAQPKDREPSEKERGKAAISTIMRFPELIDFYIKIKEQTGDKARDISKEKVTITQKQFVHQVAELQSDLLSKTPFYNVGTTTYKETHARLAYLKDAIENKGCHKLFYIDGKPVQREADLQSFSDWSGLERPRMRVRKRTMGGVPSILRFRVERRIRLLWK
jgi:hypothetical protein